MAWGKIATMRRGLAILFATAGIAQLLAPPAVRRAYARWGYPDWLRMAIGAIELEAAAMAAFRPTKHLAVAQLLPVLAGAVYTHAKTPRERMLTVVPLLTIAALLSILHEDK
jgi:hypothetical protein